MDKHEDAFWYEKRTVEEVVKPSSRWPSWLQWAAPVEVPSAAEWSWWDDFYAFYELKYPWRYWFYRRLPIWRERKCNQVRDFIWWFRYRFTDKYHIVRVPTLEPGYHDVDELMLHACFSLFNRYMESRYEIIDWEASGRAEDGVRLKALHEWWNVIRPNLPEIQYQGDTDQIRADMALEQERRDTDQRMLIELVQLRSNFW